MSDDFKNASASELLEVAHEMVDDIVKRSRIFDAESEMSLPQFDERGK